MNPEAEPKSIEDQVVSDQPKVESKTSSHTNQIAIIVLTILVLLGAGYYLFVMNPSILNMLKPQQNKINSVQPSSTIANTDTSDPQIDKDIQALNTKLSSLDTDFNNIDTGLNDVPLDK